MASKQTHLLSTIHSRGMPAYTLTDSPIDTYEYMTGKEESHKLYYANHAVLGCSKNYDSRHAAIRAMCYDHGARVVSIVDNG